MTRSVIICKKHGDFLQSMNKHLRGQGCPICKKENSAFNVINKERHDSNVKNFVEKCRKKHGDLYEYLEEYDSCYQKMLIKCNSCQNTFRQTISAHMHGNGCPYCKRSKGEICVEQWLSDNKIDYIREHWFGGCRGKKRPLPFDFWLPAYNMTIEYQGRQHYEQVNFSKAPTILHEMKNNFEATQASDAIKKKYCEDNGIRLLEISYKDLNKIPTILEQNILKTF